MHINNFLLACLPSATPAGPGTRDRKKDESDKIIRILGLLCRIHPLMKSIQKQLSFFQMWLLYQMPADACWLTNSTQCASMRLKAVNMVL